MSEEVSVTTRCEAELPIGAEGPDFLQNEQMSFSKFLDDGRCGCIMKSNTVPLEMVSWNAFFGIL